MDIKSLTDEQLMAATAQGRMSEFSELVTRHQEKAFSLALRTLGQRELAEDVSQEAFLRVFHSAKRYRPEAKFTTWFYRIIVNLCLDEKRKAKRNKLFFSDNTVVFDSQSDLPADALEVEERQKRVREALETLNQRERIAVVLHRFEGLSHADVAEATGWSRSAVEALLVRSYKKLRHELSPYQNFEK